MKIIKTSKWKEQIEGGLAERYEPSEFDTRGLEKGVKIEMEHTKDPDVAKEISMDHMVESEDFKNGDGAKYYDLLEDLERKVKERLKNKEDKK